MLLRASCLFQLMQVPMARRVGDRVQRLNAPSSFLSIPTSSVPQRGDVEALGLNAPSSFLSIPT